MPKRAVGNRMRRGFAHVVAVAACLAAAGCGWCRCAIQLGRRGAKRQLDGDGHTAASGSAGPGSRAHITACAGATSASTPAVPLTVVPAPAPPAGPSTTVAPAYSVSPSLPPQPVLDADPGHCKGTIGAVAVTDVDVPDGAVCTLNGTTVDGNVSIGAGSTLLATAVSVDGDVEADRAAAVDVTGGSFVGGDLQLQQGGSATVSRSTVDGDIEWEGQADHSTPRGTSSVGTSRQTPTAAAWPSRRTTSTATWSASRTILRRLAAATRSEATPTGNARRCEQPGTRPKAWTGRASDVRAHPTRMMGSRS